MADTKTITGRLSRTSMLVIASMIPVLVLLLMGWHRRWTADDAFVNFRVVKELRHGHGFVFNPGDRVEAGTSPLWIVVLTILDLFTPIPLEWIAALAALLMSALALWITIDTAMRLQWSTAGSPSTLLPVGALIYCVVPAAWDYATSGLENGLGILWLAVSWSMLVGPATGSTLPTRRSTGWLLLVLGIGPLIRPDFMIFTVVLGAAALLDGPRTRRALLRGAATVLALPVIAEIIRIAYFGVLAPNPAVAKEAGLSHSPQGWRYLRDFLGPYALLVPLALVVIVLAISTTRAAKQRDRLRLIVLVELAAFLHLAYVVRIGGDFMHARLLLPSFFLALAPIALLRIDGWRLPVYAALVLWAMVCATALRPGYSKNRSELAMDAIDQRSHISDERVVHVRLSGRANPVTLADFRSNFWGRGGAQMDWAIRQGLATGLILDSESAGNTALATGPLRSGLESRVVINVGALGMYSYSLPADVTVVDRFGLANPISAHQHSTGRGRPGHEKDLPLAWVVASYTDPGAPAPAGVPAAEIDAARRALACGMFPDLARARFEPIGFKHLVRNFTGAISRWRFRFTRDPFVAVKELCGD